MKKPPSAEDNNGEEKLSLLRSFLASLSRLFRHKKRTGLKEEPEVQGKTPIRTPVEHDIKYDAASSQRPAAAPDSEAEIQKSGRLQLLFGKRRHTADKEVPSQNEDLKKLVSVRAFPFFNRKRKSVAFDDSAESPESAIKSRSSFERFAYLHFAKHLPELRGYREIYEQAAIPLVYESYLSTAFLVSGIVTLPTFLISLLLEVRLLHLLILFSLLGSLVLSGIVFAASLQLWLLYPMQRRKSFKSRLDNQLAYSFGILGVLAVSGMSIERLFEKLASSESNPVLAELSKRFLRNVRLFGMDTETALREVAIHSPSLAFSKMLESIAVAFRTTGSIHDLVMYESARLFEEKRDKLRKVIGNLGIIAELYITLVIVGPIIFIVMMAIFSLLPSGGLPDPIFVINLIVFIGVPVISIMFVLMLDSLVAKA